MQGPIKGGRRGNKTRQKMSKFKRQRKESKGTSEVRRHCVHTTIQAAPTLGTGPASPQKYGCHDAPHPNSFKPKGLQQVICCWFHTAGQYIKAHYKRADKRGKQFNIRL